jgi:CHAT domain-containing protein
LSLAEHATLPNTSTWSAWAEPFMYAGAPSVISTLWNVDDESAQVLTTAYYRHLEAGASKAEALRQAQADTRADYPNPYYSAGFVLTGDPGALNTPDRPDS